MEELLSDIRSRQEARHRADLAAGEARRRADLAAREAAARAEQERVRQVLASIEDPKVRELVCALDDALGAALGSATGYVPSLGGPRTRRLQNALGAFGVTPDYGFAYGLGHRPR